MYCSIPKSMYEPSGTGCRFVFFEFDDDEDEEEDNFVEAELLVAAPVVVVVVISMGFSCFDGMIVVGLISLFPPIAPAVAIPCPCLPLVVTGDIFAANSFNEDEEEEDVEEEGK